MTNHQRRWHLGREDWRRVLALYRMLAPHRRYGVAAVLLMLAVALLQLPTPLLTRYLIDKVFTGTGSFGLEAVCAVLLLVLLINAVSGLASGWFSGLFRERATAAVELRLLAHVLSLEMSWLREKKPGYLMSRIAADTGNLQGFLVDTLVSLFTNGFTFVIGLVAVFWLAPNLAGMVMVLLPFYILSLVFHSRRIQTATDRMREHSAAVTGDLGEAVSTLPTLKAFTAEEQSVARFGRRLDHQIGFNLDALRWNLRSGVLANLLSGAASALALYFGGRMILAGELTLGTLVAFLSFLGYVFGPAAALTTLHDRLQNSRISLERVFEILDLKGERVPDTGEESAIHDGSVSFAGVCFAYPDGPRVLTDVDLEVPAGAKVALVGPSGAGKTTLVNLLMKFDSPAAGTIRLGGALLADCPPAAVRRAVALVPQEVALFTGTVRANIALGRAEASFDEIKEAARAAHAEAFVERLQNGYDTEIGVTGHRLSGGERQRLAIARAILRRPKLMIMDEATSDLDAESEAAIASAVDGLAGRMTLLVIAHRLATVQKADLIYVLDLGRVIGRGTHRELLRDCPLYKNLCQQQLIVGPEAMTG